MHKQLRSKPVRGRFEVPTIVLRLGAAGLVALGACSDPSADNPGAVNRVSAPAAEGGPPAEAELSGDCPVSPEWIPTGGGPPPPVTMQAPATHPSPECPFYQGAFQNFLIAAYPDANGDPAIASYPTIDDAFLRQTPPDRAALGAHRGTAKRAWLGVIKQAGLRQILIDQNGHTLYYGIHMNQAMADFIKENGLQTLSGVQNADPQLFFPGGMVEFKTAWMDVDPADGVSGDWSTYITTMAWVPTIHQDATTQRISEDADHPRQIKVALIALHSVFTFPGHPEFVWGSVQHVSAGGGDHLQGAPLGYHANGAPTTDFNPDVVRDPDNHSVSAVPSQSTQYSDYLLYRPNTPVNAANVALPESQLTLDEATQSFPRSQASSIYRQYPGSKSEKIDPDDDVTSLNQNFTALLAQRAAVLSPADKRGNYRLVGAQWLDKPAMFKLDSSLQNDGTSPLFGLTNAASDEPFSNVSQDGDRQALLAAGVKPADDLLQNGSDSPFSMTGGEDRMSSTAMESFTQSPESFRNCFSCHNTQAVNANGTPATAETTAAGVRKLLDAKLINVSHLFSEFVLSETGE